MSQREPELFIKPKEADLSCVDLTKLESQITNTIMAGQQSFSMINADAQFFARQLTPFYPKMLTKKYADLRFREYTVISRCPPYAKERAYEMVEFKGFNKLKNHRAGDIPVVDTAVQEDVAKIYNIPVAVEWDHTELMAAKLAEPLGGQLSMKRLEAKDRFIEQQLNDLFLFGDDEYGVSGLLTDPTITKETVAKKWSVDAPTGATPEEKLQDLLDGYNKMLGNSKGKFSANQVVMSLAAFTDVNGTPRSVYSDFTVIGWFQKNMPTVERIIVDAFLDGQGEGGSNVIIYMDKDEDNYHMNIPLEMQMLPPQYEGMKIKLPFYTRASGLVVLQSRSIFIYQGL